MKMENLSLRKLTQKVHRLFTISLLLFMLTLYT